MTEEYLTWLKNYDDAMNMIERREEIDKARAFVGDFGGNCTGGQAGGGSAGGHRVIALRWDQAMDFDKCVWFIIFP